MAKYSQTQLVHLISDPSIEGAIIGIIESGSETRYQVFTNTLGIQTYYESQLALKDAKTELEQVDASRFHAGLTASLIRNPSLSSLYSLNAARIDFKNIGVRPL